MTNINGIIYSIITEEFLNQLTPTQAALKGKNYDAAMERAHKAHHRAAVLSKASGSYIDNAKVSFPVNYLAISHINPFNFPVSTLLNHGVAVAIHGRSRAARKKALDEFKQAENLKRQQDSNYHRTARFTRVKDFKPVSYHLKISDQDGGKFSFLGRHLNHLSNSSKFFDYLNKAGGGANRAWSDWQTGTAKFFTKGRFIPKRVLDKKTGKKYFDTRMAWAPKAAAYRRSHAFRGVGQAFKYLGKAFTHGLGHDFVKKTTTGARLRSYLLTKGIKVPALGVNHGNPLFGPKSGPPIGSNNNSLNKAASSTTTATK